MFHRGVIMGGLVATLAACSPGPKIVPAYDPARSPVADPVEQEPQVSALSAGAVAMHGWLVELGPLRDAVVGGDLAAATDGAGRWVSGFDGEVMAWGDSVREIRAEGSRLAKAQSLEDAAVSVARIASRCGRCHEARGVVERVDAALPPDDDPPPAGVQPDEMLRHQWAAVRMWEGLVAPSLPRWIRGTTLFAILPDCPSDPDDVSSNCGRARAIARRARRAEHPADRSALYGRLLATCADCHAPKVELTRANMLVRPR